MSRFTCEVLDGTTGGSKGYLIVTAKPMPGGTLNVGAKALTLQLGCDPTRTTAAGIASTDPSFHGGLVDGSGKSNGLHIAPFDLVRLTLLGFQQPGAAPGTDWNARWKYRKMQRPNTEQGVRYSTTLEPLNAELTAGYKANWSTQAVAGFDTLGATAFDQPIVDAITTKHLTKHCVLVAHSNDGHVYEFNFQRDIRSVIDIAVGMGGASWWWYEMDGQVEAPKFGDRSTHVISYAAVSQRPDENPDDSEKVYNDIDLTGGLTLDSFGFPTPLTSHRTITSGTYGTATVGTLAAPPLSDPTLMSVATLNQRGDAILSRHQILQQSGVYRIITPDTYRPGDKVTINEADGSTTGPLFITDWDVEEWGAPNPGGAPLSLQVCTLASTFGDYHGNPAMSTNLGASSLMSGEVTGGGLAVAAGCGGLTLFFIDDSTPNVTYPNAHTGTLGVGTTRVKSTPYVIADGSSCSMMFILYGTIRVSGASAGDEMRVQLFIGTAPGLADVMSGFGPPVPVKDERVTFVSIIHTGSPLPSLGVDGSGDPIPYYLSVVAVSPDTGGTYITDWQVLGTLA